MSEQGTTSEISPREEAGERTASTGPQQRSGPLTGQTLMHTLPLFSSPLAPWDATGQPDAHGRAAGGTTRSPALRSSLPDATWPATVDDGPLQKAPADPPGTATTGHPEERVRGWHPPAPGQTPAAGWRGLVWDCWVPVALHHKTPQLPTLLLPGRELARFACRLPLAGTMGSGKPARAHGWHVLL